MTILDYLPCGLVQKCLFFKASVIFDLAKKCLSDNVWRFKCPFSHVSIKNVSFINVSFTDVSFFNNNGWRTNKKSLFVRYLFRSQKPRTKDEWPITKFLIYMCLFCDQWRVKDEGRRTKDEGRRTKDKLQRTKTVNLWCSFCQRQMTKDESLEDKVGYTANTSCGRVGRGGYASFPIFRLVCYGPTDRRMDGQSLL